MTEEKTDPLTEALKSLSAEDNAEPQAPKEDVNWQFHERIVALEREVAQLTHMIAERDKYIQDRKAELERQFTVIEHLAEALANRP